MRPAAALERPTVSIIIPTLNEGRSLGAALEAVARVRGRVEVIVVDGGSDDETLEIAGRFGARVIRSERGRGHQMHAGARAARGEALWFLHADTLAPPDGAERITEALKDDSEAVGGNFTIRFDGERRAARFLTWLYPQLRRIGLCYGDSAIFVRASRYREVGGFNPFPLFEDVDLVRRLRRKGRLVHLPAAVVTSSRRFEGRSFALTFARWAFLQALYWAGVNPRTLNRLYAPIRRSR
ncbi:MAG TPA: TIGR04283 family arsenosugar biosynthesis glycosyltransferase [Pyrinomonadaceae bacterium]|nr:TIGR04283 family arsenosugar biosynthesis glycosyltransferase [Pyrinomonadaceae bacterium]